MINKYSEMKKTLFVITALLLLLRCGDPLKDKNKSIHVHQVNVNLNQNPERIDLMDIVENLSFIQLETNRECLLSRIHKVEVFNNRIYISESGASGKLLCFDLHGKFLFKIGDKGNGPGEYLFLADFAIDKENKCLWLSDNFRKILKFDLDGKFIERYDTDFAMMNLSLLDEKENIMAIRLGYYKDKDYSFIIYSNKKRKILYHKSSNHINTITTIGGAFLSQSKEKIFYTEPFNDTIFNITKEGIEPYYIINFGKHALPKEELKSDQPKNIITQFLNPDNKYAGFVMNVSKSSDYLLFNYDFSGERYTSIFSSKLDKIITIKEILLIGKSFEASKYFFKYQQNDEYISWLPAHLLTEQSLSKKEKQYYGKYHEITNLISNLNEDDNPILIFGKFNFDYLFNE